MKYATIEFFEALADALNQDASFQSKTSNLATTLLFHTNDRPDAALLTVDHGKASAKSVAPQEKADFVFFAPYDVWISNHRDGVTLEKLIMTGKVKFKGSIPKIMTLKGQLSIIDAKAKAIAADY